MYLVWNSYVSCCVETAWLYESFHRFRRSCIVLGEVAWLWRGCVRLWRGCVKMLGYSACLLGRGCVTPSLRFVGTAAYQIWVVGLVRTGKARVRSACGIFWESFLAFPLISFALAVIIVSVNKATVCLGCWLAQPLLETSLLSHPIFDERRPPPTDNIWQYFAIYHDIGQWEPQFPAISFSEYQKQVTTTFDESIFWCNFTIFDYIRW